MIYWVKVIDLLWVGSVWTLQRSSQWIFVSSYFGIYVTWLWAYCLLCSFGLVSWLLDHSIQLHFTHFLHYFLETLRDFPSPKPLLRVESLFLSQSHVTLILVGAYKWDICQLSWCCMQITHNVRVRKMNR